jgi:hypothetical protein
MQKTDSRQFRIGVAAEHLRKAGEILDAVRSEDEAAASKSAGRTGMRHETKEQAYSFDRGFELLRRNYRPSAQTQNEVFRMQRDLLLQQMAVEKLLLGL